MVGVELVHDADGWCLLYAVLLLQCAGNGATEAAEEVRNSHILLIFKF